MAITLVDKSLSFGQQNFFFHDLFTDDLTYDYAVFVDKKGAIFLSRFNKDATEGRYFITTGDYATVVAARGTYTYTIISELEDPRI